MGKIKGRLLKELKKLETKEFEEFKFYLEDYGNNKDRDILSISPSDLENANRIKTVDLIVHMYTKQALDVTCQVLQEVGRNDVKESLSQSNRGKTANTESLYQNRTTGSTTLKGQLILTLTGGVQLIKYTNLL